MLADLTLPVVYGFGRSGTTLLNQCLGCFELHAVLSEVNPAASVLPVAWQARHWLDLVDDAELPRFSRLSYVGQLTSLCEKAASAGRTLIVRDWTTVNFLAGTRAGICPSGVLEQDAYLEAAGISRKAIVICRRTEDVFQSFRRSFSQFRSVTAEDFGRAYLNYASQVRRFPVVQLEAFTEAPQKHLQTICSTLGIHFPLRFAEKFSDFTQCTGNTAVEQGKSGQELRRVLPSSSPSSHPYFDEADHLFGYERPH